MCFIIVFKILCKEYTPLFSVLGVDSSYFPALWLVVIQSYSVHFNSVAQLGPTLCNPKDYCKPGFTVHHQLPGLLKLMSLESVMPSNHLILCCPLLLLPSIFPSIRVFSNESVPHIRCRFSFNIRPSNEYSGLISFRMNWLGLHAVHDTLKSLRQYHSSKASILWHSAFLIVQLSHPYMATMEKL